MKKYILFLLFVVSLFLPAKYATAQLIHLDAISGFPDTVINNEQVTMSMFFSNSGGAVFSGDLEVYIHAVGTDSSTTGILHSDTAYVLSGNTTSDTIEVTYTFNASEFDGGDNIVVVWPASSQMPGFVSGDSLTFALFFKNVGIEENEMIQSVQLFPSASGDEIRLHYAFPEKIEQVRIFDAMGKMISASARAVSSLRVDNLPGGFYFIQVIARDKTTIVKKFFRE